MKNGSKTCVQDFACTDSKHTKTEGYSQQGEAFYFLFRDLSHSDICFEGGGVGAGQVVGG